VARPEVNGITAWTKTAGLNHGDSLTEVAPNPLRLMGVTSEGDGFSTFLAPPLHDPGSNLSADIHL
jgi:hypothetical protein